jgi:hypothetical protein
MQINRIVAQANGGASFQPIKPHFTRIVSEAVSRHCGLVIGSNCGVIDHVEGD